MVHCGVVLSGGCFAIYANCRLEFSYQGGYGGPPPQQGYYGPPPGQQAYYGPVRLGWREDLCLQCPTNARITASTWLWPSVPPGTPVRRAAPKTKEGQGLPRCLVSSDPTPNAERASNTEIP